MIKCSPPTDARRRESVNLVPRACVSFPFRRIRILRTLGTRLGKRKSLNKIKLSPDGLKCQKITLILILIWTLFLTFHELFLYVHTCITVFTLVEYEKIDSQRGA